jgi:hypothetical protein
MRQRLALVANRAEQCRLRLSGHLTSREADGPVFMKLGASRAKAPTAWRMVDVERRNWSDRGDPAAREHRDG